MDYFINKNILIDELLELELTYDYKILDIFEQLRNNRDYEIDIILFNDCIDILESVIYELSEYLKTIVDLEWESIYIDNQISCLYIVKINIIDFLNNTNNVDVLSELMDEFDLK